MILPGSTVSKLCEKYSKINPAGVDLPPKKIFRFREDIEYIFLEGKKRGFITRDNKFLDIKECLVEIFPKNKFWELEEGIYYVVFPKVSIPKNCIGLALPRSSLNRLGIIKSESALFEPGYTGEFEQTFYFTRKAKIYVNEGWVQLILIRLDFEGDYKGFWQGENY